MASSPTKTTFIILELENHLPVESVDEHKEIFISTQHINSWNLPSILSHQSIQIQADRTKLIQSSSYFNSLLTGSFSESCLDAVSVHWNLEVFIDVIKFIYGAGLDVSVNNFIPLMEGALFFGVEALLFECMTWFSMTTTAKESLTLKVPLAAIVEFWNFGLEHAIDSILEQCTEYLARNIMCAISCSSFAEVPYNLLSCCLEHPHLTVDSEKNIVEALLCWLEVNTRSQEGSSSLLRDDHNNILKTVRTSLLPLWFATGRKRNRHFSELADQGISFILSAANNSSMNIMRMLNVGELDGIRIRLTEYTQRLDLSGCPQITSDVLLLSLLPWSERLDPRLKERFEQFLIDTTSLDMRKYAIPQNLCPHTLFEAVREVDVSKCPQLDLEAAISCFSESFPSLKTLKASYCKHFKTTTLFHLVRSCPQVNEVYLNADISPALPTHVSTISTNIDGYGDQDMAPYRVLKERPLSSKITKLILSGRTEIDDMDLISISVFCGTLCYLNIKGCTSITDIGISKLILKCLNLHSIIASDTYFGEKSVLALCSAFPSVDCSTGVQHEHSSSVASRLRKLHIGGCKNVDVTHMLRLISDTYMLKSLSLRGTFLNDDAMRSFLGSSLERLNVSDTMISGTALTYIVRRNPGLKLIKSRGCRKLCHIEDNLEQRAHSYGCSKSETLYVEIGRTCNLEYLVLGWGFSSLSLDTLGPAVKSLRSLTLGLGASSNETALMLLPSACPLLESLILNFQVISGIVVKSIVESLKRLEVLGLCYCLGDLYPSSFHINMPNLRKLHLERVIPWLTNNDLVILTQNCTNLIELSLSGCTRLNSDSQQVISCGWPGLVSIQLEDCGEVTLHGVSALLDCVAMEDLSLRHNGCGIQRNFILHAAAKMPMLRKITLDLCDASGGGFDSPSYADRYFLRSVTIARCKLQKCAFGLQNAEACRRAVHKESIVLEWNSKGLRTTVVQERV